MATTSGQGIAHLAFRAGGEPFCKSRRACASVTPDNQHGYQICKRCEAKAKKMAERAAARAAKAA